MLNPADMLAHSASEGPRLPMTEPNLSPREWHHSYAPTLREDPRWVLEAAIAWPDREAGTNRR